MFNKLLKSRKTEQGASTLILYLLLMPLFIMVFGYGVDTAIATYTKNTLQDSLDAATLSAVALSTNPASGSTNGEVSIRPESLTVTTVKDLYDINRSGKVPALLQCYTKINKPVEPGYTTITPSANSMNTNPSKKCYQMSAPKITYSGVGNRTKNLEVTVIEYSRNPFLAVIFPELQYQQYVITSRATITTANG